MQAPPLQCLTIARCEHYSYDNRRTLEYPFREESVLRICAVLLLTIAGSLAYGQTAAGTLTGIVTDPSGSVIAGVPVVATHVETGTKITGTTSQTGNYTIPQLPVGRYAVTLEQPGFKMFRQENVIIAAAQALRLDVSLEVGATTESVTV